METIVIWRELPKGEGKALSRNKDRAISVHSIVKKAQRIRLIYSTSSTPEL